MNQKKNTGRKFITSLTKKSVGEKRVSLPRKTKRSWMNDECYISTYEVGGKTFTLNVMEVAERMCKSNKWDKAVVTASNKTDICIGLPSSNNKLKTLWAFTMRYRGSPPRGVSNAPSIRITKGSRRGAARGGSGYGVTMRCGETSLGETIGVLLHELVHVVQGEQISYINGKRRPHDLRFNLILTRMAKSFFGYPFHPYEVGFKVGRGYAPSRHLYHWIKEQLDEGNPKILKWFKEVK